MLPILVFNFKLLGITTERVITMPQPLFHKYKRSLLLDRNQTTPTEINRNIGGSILWGLAYSYYISANIYIDSVLAKVSNVKTPLHLQYGA